MVPTLTPDQLVAAHQVADDAGRVAAAFPPWEVLKREFPDCYSETPDGKFRVRYRSPKNTVDQNERNSKKVQAMLGEYQKVSLETSSARDHMVPTVAVRGHDGVVINVPAGQERNAAKKGFKPHIRWGRATRYWTDANGQKWKRPPGGEWEADNG